MLKKCCWLFCLMTTVVTDAASPEILGDSSLLRLLGKRYSGVHSPRTHWSYHPQDDFYRRDSQAVSHGHASHPYDSALKATEGSSEHPGYSLSSEEHWRPSSAGSNFTGAHYYGYSRTHFGSSGATAGPQDSSHQYQQIRTTAGGHFAYKKTPVQYVKGTFQSSDASGKPKYKKPTPHQSPTGYKKTAYPRVHKPYVKHKYPTRKTVHPFYRRYYQSPYQRYEIPSREFLRYKANPQIGGYYKASTSSPSLASVSQRYHTTERMDDAYPEGSSPSEDYSAYNDTRLETGNYYEAYEEVEKTTSEPEESSYDESTIRGYYGDRIYMSTQTPLVASDKTALKNKYFIIRRTSNDDEDIETIFE